jgi:hypothetical protein
MTYARLLIDMDAESDPSPRFIPPPDQPFYYHEPFAPSPSNLNWTSHYHY